MSHSRDHIITALMPVLDNPTVRDHWTSGQCVHVDAIRACAPEWTDEQFRYVQRRLAQAFCTGD